MNKKSELIATYIICNHIKKRKQDYICGDLCMHKHIFSRINKLISVISCLGEDWEPGKGKIEVRDRLFLCSC